MCPHSEKGVLGPPLSQDNEACQGGGCKEGGAPGRRLPEQVAAFCERGAFLKPSGNSKVT